MSLIRWIDFQSLGDDRGELIALEIGMEKTIPFEIKRVYYIYRTAEGVSRGFHAHRNLKQVAVCISGRCRMVIDDGQVREEVWMSSPSKGLLIKNMVWREMHDFSADCVLLVLASEHYNEADYIRNYQDFLVATQKVEFVVYDNEFLNNSWEWLNDPELMELTRTEPFTREQQLFFYNSLPFRTDYKVWGVSIGNEKIGVVGLKRIIENESAEYFGYIGNKGFWGKGISKYIFDFIVGFSREANLKKIYLEVAKDNKRAINSYNKNGFEFSLDKGDTVIMDYYL